MVISEGESDEISDVRRQMLNGKTYIRFEVFFMSALYILVAPLFLVVLFRRIMQLTSAFRKRDNDQMKVHLLFLSLIVIVELIVVLAIERRLGF